MKNHIRSFRNWKLTFGVLAAGILMSALMTSCMKSNDNTTSPDTAGLMAFNLATDQNAVGISLSGSNLFSSPLSYTSYTGGYLGIYTGNRTVQSFDFNGGAVLASTPSGFVAKKFYSAFVTGAAGNYRNIVVEDNIDSLSGASGKAYIRYINAVPDSVTVPQIVISSNGANLVNKASAYGEVSGFISADPGTVTVDFNNGSSIDADRTFTLEAKKVYTVLLTGLPGSTTAPVSIKYVENGTLSDQ